MTTTSGDSLHQRKAQLDKEEREHLERVVADMRDRVEDNVEFQLTQKGLDDESDDLDSLDEEARQLHEAIELEVVDGHTWAEAFDQYVTGVGYTVVNRLAALRCMEVRGFVDEEVTVFKDNGLTPAAETLVHEEFLLEDEAILAAYHDACDELAEEIEILFDRETAYSQVDPDDDTFEELCGLLDEVPDEVWRADDVLGWVYEYYNVKLLDDLRRKGDREGLDPGDVPPANQFYTPHWVVRMLTDNSLGKLYLEDGGELRDVVDAQRSLSADERKNRPLAPDEAPDVADFCTYLVPSEDAGEPTDFDHPADLRVVDPACGSGHFLLYAFDVLERIWRAECPALDRAEIPRKILQHNLYGVDLDMRACQLAAFNLYLKGRTRAEAEGADGFDMPKVGIVCADASIAESESAEAVFDEVAEGRPEVRDALQTILESFEDVHGLGSLLDVRATLQEQFEEGKQMTLSDAFGVDHTLSDFLHSLRDAIEQRREGSSFLAQDLKSFVRLLDVLAQDYDVALMNPPYGSQNRMPDSVQAYVESSYRYSPEFYINFFEVCERITKENGRVGMLVPWSFMFKQTFRDFREDFVGAEGGFDFLAEFGYGVLDNATVGTVGTVVKTATESPTERGTFLRLHDVDAKRKEQTFTENVLAGADDGVKRLFDVDLGEFSAVPGTPICYSIPREIRLLHDTDAKLDADRADVDGESIADAVQGLATGNNDRFIRSHWEVSDFDAYRPIAKGGSEAWTLPRVTATAAWADDGKLLKRAGSSVIRNEELYGRAGLTWTYIKRTGRRFGYFPADGLFSHTGFMLFPKDDLDLWTLMGALNSDLYHNLFLSLTTERHWNVGEVGRIPWHETLEDADEIGRLAREQYGVVVGERVYDPTSPYYVGPGLLPGRERTEFFYDHPHAEQADEIVDADPGDEGPERPLPAVARDRIVESRRNRQRLESLADRIDEIVYDALGVDSGTRSDARREIFLRTAEDPEDREVPDPESVPEVPDAFAEEVQKLVHHFALEAVRADDGGVVSLVDCGDASTLHDRVVERFHEVYGEYAEDRLQEVDDALGARPADAEAYPNLRTWLVEDLFEYHVEVMENAPILWKLTTRRLVSDPDGEGFACVVDYRGLDSGLFDRVTNRYLEPRKADLRDRRNAAERRRNDESLSASEQADAAEAHDRAVSGLEQIRLFEETIQELASESSRRVDDRKRERAEALRADVAEFRAATRSRLDALDRLAADHDDEWLAETFSPTFYETVEANREEWMDALADLEDACETYAQSNDGAIPAHLYDLFEYFGEVVGSDHYSSNGVLFTTYYFEREGEDFLDARGEPKPDLADEDARLLAELAANLDEYKALADEIEDGCRELRSDLPSEWSSRALAEITASGYRPNLDHGVAINVAPLADAEIVPEVVDEDVL